MTVAVNLLLVIIAGTVLGTTYGVAKGAQVYDMKVCKSHVFRSSTLHDNLLLAYATILRTLLT